MPGINGFELLKQLSNSGTDIPVIIMTAYSDLDTTQQVFQEGAFAYLPKPFDIDDALDAVNRACRHRNKNNSASPAVAQTESVNWQDSLRQWAQAELANGEQNILKNASLSFEKVLLECALEKTRGRKQEAARLLGWGRNTLTRKLKELALKSPTKD
ncbi:MAG: DNA-binding NtrC family response regulator [Planctomycetota bacterium]|jgi:DNA-binding NtrC family response regulator